MAIKQREIKREKKKMNESMFSLIYNYIFKFLILIEIRDTRRTILYVEQNNEIDCKEYRYRHMDSK